MFGTKAGDFDSVEMQPDTVDDFYYAFIPQVTSIETVYYYIHALDSAWEPNESYDPEEGAYTFVVTPVGIGESSIIPRKFELMGIRPNPVRKEEFYIYLSIPKRSKVKLEIFDVSGRRVLNNHFLLDPGYRKLKVTGIPKGGIYFVIVSSDKNRFIHILSHNFHEYMFIFAALGTFLSFFHQGSLGGTFGVLFTRPYAYRTGFFVWPWTFFLAILSAIASGPALTLLITWLMQKVTRRKLVSYDVLELMGKIAGTLLCVYMVFKLIDTWYWIRHVLPSKGMTLMDCYKGWFGSYGLWLLVAELGIFGVVPAIILVTPKLRKKEFWLILGALFDCIGVSINRFVMVLQSSAVPTYPFDKWPSYMPSWQEWATFGMVVAVTLLVISLSYRYLPLFPQEKELNAN
jgi:hypothetical protein